MRHPFIYQWPRSRECDTINVNGCQWLLMQKSNVMTFLKYSKPLKKESIINFCVNIELQVLLRLMLALRANFGLGPNSAYVFDRLKKTTAIYLYFLFASINYAQILCKNDMPF